MCASIGISKSIAKSLADQSKKNLGERKSNDFFISLKKVEVEYEQKYMFDSTAIELQKLKSFNKWLSDIIKDKDILTPIIIDQMVNEEDLYSLSIYQNFHAGTALIPNIDGEYKDEYYESDGGEDTLA